MREKEGKKNVRTCMECLFLPFRHETETVEFLGESDRKRQRGEM